MELDDTGLKSVFKNRSYEDYIEYFIFFRKNPSKSADELLTEIRAAVQYLSGNYIWQKDSISVKKVNLKDVDETEEEAEDLICFHGVTRFGENVEDEWFATWLMMELSKKFPDCVIRVIDNDGEFLLIEAADQIPDWAESDQICQKRVYLHKGRVHLIPRLDDPSKNICAKKQVKMAQAVNIVLNHPSITIASGSVQQAIQSRLAKFPLKEDEFMHVNLMLPPKLAAILKINPELVAPAVEAFYYREPIELNAARLMKNFKPGEGLVKARVRLTKCLYAMLTKQDFNPDKKSGWAFPLPNSADFKSHNLGAKLTIGFEILMTRVKGSASSSQTKSAEIENTVGYLRYVENLEKYGYFQGLLKDSKPYQELEAKARNYYLQNVAAERNANSFSVEQKLRQLVDSVPVDLKSLEEQAKDLPPDDDDSWLNVTPEGFESMLQHKFGSMHGGSEKPEDIPQKLREFMGRMAELEGVDLPSSTRQQSNGHEDKSEHSEGMLDPMDFRADDFVSAMDKLLTDLGKPDRDWDESDDSYSDDEGEAMAEIMKKHTFKKDSKFHQLMNAMDTELAGTDVAKTCMDEEEFEDVESFEPVDIDTAALRNMLKSFQSQEGPTGPSTNLLRSVCFDISRASEPAAGSSSSSQPSRGSKKQSK